MDLMGVGKRPPREAAAPVLGSGRLLPGHPAPVEIAALELAEDHRIGEPLARTQAEGDVVGDMVVDEPESRLKLVVPG
jgi:hypothetical protein